MQIISLLLKFSAFLIILNIFVTPLFPIFAKQPGYLETFELNSFGITSFEKINPNLLIYPVKRISEQLKLNLIFNKDQKKKYMLDLYEIRLKELVYIINNKKEGFLIFTADRYNSFVGRIKKEYPIEFNSRIKFQNHVKLLERLRDIYPARSENWDKLQQTIDTTKSLI